MTLFFNPVTKVPVIISGDEGAVFIEVVKEVARVEFARTGGGGDTGGTRSLRTFLVIAIRNLATLPSCARCYNEHYNSNQTTRVSL